MLSTPILFLIFNRPDTTQKVFEEIRKQKPKHLYIAADGARPEKVGEAERCEQTRKLVLDAIDWDCEVKTLFRDKNLGCGLAVSSAITWFFEHVEKGIILEDDCLPNHYFFKFCEEMLDTYANDMRVCSISGFNFGFETDTNFTSRFMNMWGWATWRRSALSVDYQMKTWHSKKPWQKELFIISNIKQSLAFSYTWMRFLLFHFDNTSIENNKNNIINTWDYQWVYHCLSNKQLTIFPKNNYIKNIGFGNEFATHTILENPISEIESILVKHSSEINFSYDREFEQKALMQIWCQIHDFKFRNIISYIFKKAFNRIF